MQFVKKQEVVEAVQWNGTQESLLTVQKIVSGVSARFEKMRPPLNVPTPKGPQRAEMGDWVVRDVTGAVTVWDDVRFSRAFGAPPEAAGGLTQETIAELLAEQMQAVKGLLVTEDKVRAIVIGEFDSLKQSLGNQSVEPADPEVFRESVAKIVNDMLAARKPGRKAKNG